MLTDLTPRKDSAAYVAIERVTGTLAGRTGRFKLTQLGVMDRGAPEPQVAVVPDSAPTN